MMAQRNENILPGIHLSTEARDLVHWFRACRSDARGSVDRSGPHSRSVLHKSSPAHRGRPRQWTHAARTVPRSAGITRGDRTALQSPEREHLVLQWHFARPTLRWRLTMAGGAPSHMHLQDRTGADIAELRL